MGIVHRERVHHPLVNIGSALVSIASSESLPSYSFSSAGLINFFIPAGGG